MIMEEKNLGEAALVAKLESVSYAIFTSMPLLHHTRALQINPPRQFKPAYNVSGALHQGRMEFEIRVRRAMGRCITSQCHPQMVQ